MVIMTDQKKKDLQLAASAIEQLYHTISDAVVSVAPDDDREILVVRIEGAIYRVNVECENVKAMVQQVVNATILKI